MRLWGPLAITTLAVLLPTSAFAQEAREAPAASASPSPPLVGATARPDYDGDGHADLAIGAPHARAGKPDAGVVHVLYGSAAGLDTEQRQVLTQDSPELRAKGLRAERGDQFGWSLCSGDFDGDGYTDLAIGARFEDDGAPDAGIVQVLYGGPGGLGSARSQVWSQGSPGIAERPERGDQFGWSMAAGDFDADGFEELVIGVHQEDAGAPNTGVVHVLRGSARGLTARGSQLWSQDSPGIAEASEADDQFGRTLAVSDFDGDGYADLAIGAPYEDRVVDRVGVVHVLYGDRRGLRAEGSQLWHQDAPGIAEHAELRDQFGQSLAAGDLDGDGRGDLVVGVWFEDYLNPLSNEGGFHVIYGSRAGLSGTRDRFWSEDSPGTLDRSDPSDRFGQVLSVADFDGDGRDDLAVGSPSSDLGKGIHQNRGAVHVLRGSRRGIRAAGDQYLSQRTVGVPDRAETGDHFGEALASADFDGDGHADLAIGVPYEDRVARDDGAVYVIFGSERGLDVGRDQLIDLTTEGLDGRSRAGAHFGWAMTGEHSNSGVPRTADPDI